jgi:hypothetical protein
MRLGDFEGRQSLFQSASEQDGKMTDAVQRRPETKPVCSSVARRQRLSDVVGQIVYEKHDHHADHKTRERNCRRGCPCHHSNPASPHILSEVESHRCHLKRPHFIDPSPCYSCGYSCDTSLNWPSRLGKVPIGGTAPAMSQPKNPSEPTPGKP